eukprot:g24506.t1
MHKVSLPRVWARAFSTSSIAGFAQRWGKIFEDRQFLDSLAADGVSWLNTHGAAMHIAGAGGALQLVHAPVSLLPAPIPERYYKQLQQIMPALNTIMDKVSMDHDFLQNELKRSGDADPAFTGKLLSILSQLQKEGSAACPHRVAIHRNDFMMQPNVGPLMIEFNTIAASFGSLSTWVARLHQFLLQRFQADIAARAQGAVEDMAVLPPNDSLRGIADTLAEARNLHFRD